MPELQDAAMFCCGQDGWEVAASGAAARQQDITQCLPGDLALGAFASRGGKRADSTEALSRPTRSVTLMVIPATVSGRFLLPPLAELFTGKSITNSIEIQRARFAALQQDVWHLHDDLNWEKDELDLLALRG